jgi:hypothetical protein
MSPGSKAWIGLTGYVVVYDAWAAVTGNETLSSAFYRSFSHPVRRMPLLVLWAYLTAHLFHLLPERWDPLRRLGGFGG